MCVLSTNYLTDSCIPIHRRLSPHRRRQGHKERIEQELLNGKLGDNVSRQSLTSSWHLSSLWLLDWIFFSRIFFQIVPIFSFGKPTKMKACKSGTKHDMFFFFQCLCEIKLKQLIMKIPISLQGQFGKLYVSIDFNLKS